MKWVMYAALPSLIFWGKIYIFIIIIKDLEYHFLLL